MNNKKVWTIYISIFMILIMMLPFLPGIFNKPVGGMALSGWMWLGIGIFIPVLQFIQDKIITKLEQRNQ